MKSSLAVIVILALLAIAGWQTWQGLQRPHLQHRIAIIKQDQDIIAEIDLDTLTEPREIVLPGKYHEIVQAEPGRIRFKQADCPDKICVNTGWLDKPGETAVCLPNRAVISIAD